MEKSLQVQHEVQRGRGRRLLRYVPFARELVAMGFALKDPATPFWLKAAVAGACAYFVLPIDVLPDWIPVIGLADDGGVLLGTLGAVARQVKDIHRQAAREWIIEKTE